MIQRKNFTSLTSDERDALGNAFNGLYGGGSNSFLVEANAQLHAQYFNNGIHWGPAFMPWHRDFLRKFEIALREIEPDVSLPFWDWTQGNSVDIEVSPWKEFFGGRENTGGKFDNWSYDRLDQPPINPSTGQPWVLPPQNQILDELNVGSFTDFRRMEMGSHFNAHNWIGQTMASANSPLDPFFYLHHCNLDRLWSIWQLNNTAVAQYELGPPIQAPSAQVPLDDQMVKGSGLIGDDEGVTPASVLSHTALGYYYEEDPLLAQAWEDRFGTVLITNEPPLVA